MKKIVILISGRGSNMQAIVKAMPMQIAAVVSNQKEAPGLLFAEQKGIPTAVVSHQDFTNRETFDRALIEVIDTFQPDLVVLAGFMRILSAEFVGHYTHRLMNIHPSLLPAFTGLNTHQRVIDSGVKFSGCTVHFVTETLDHGPIIVQSVVPVLENDTEDTLAARILQEEHQIYPKAVRWFIEDRLEIQGNRVLQRNIGFSKNLTPLPQ